jgi:hypothetical protein
VLSFADDRGRMHDTVRDNGYRVPKSGRGWISLLSLLSEVAGLVKEKPVLVGFRVIWQPANQVWHPCC